MSAGSKNGTNGDEVAGELRRLAGSPANRRSLNALPQFRLEPRLPGEMTELLARLERAAEPDAR